MIVIPENILYNFVNALLQAVIKDYQTHNDKSLTMLYRMLKDIETIEGPQGKYNYYDQGVDLFMRGVDHPRQLQTRLFFDSERARIPTIHLTLPSEQFSSNAIGVGEGKEIYIDSETQSYKPQYSRSFQANYNIIFTSDNTFEVILMYQVVRGLIISVLDVIDFSGLQNPQLTGGDLNINSELVPTDIFMRALGISFIYTVEVPRFSDSKFVNQLISKFNILPKN